MTTTTNQPSSLKEKVAFAIILAAIGFALWVWIGGRDHRSCMAEYHKAGYGSGAASLACDSRGR